MHSDDPYHLLTPAPQGGTGRDLPFSRDDTDRAAFWLSVWTGPQGGGQQPDSERINREQRDD